MTVADEGAGIPQNELPNVFDNFHRVRKTDRKIAGTGLGLSVARGFVESFGGTLVAANREPGPGAIFTFRLPVARPQVGG